MTPRWGVEAQPLQNGQSVRVTYRDEENVALLVVAIQLFADCPCDSHRESFLRAFQAVDELGFEIVETNVPADEDRWVTLGADDHLSMLTATFGGQRFMVAFPSREIGDRVRPESSTVGAIGVTEACRMVLRSDLAGIVVLAGTDDAAWGAVTRQAIAEMLD